MQLISLQNW